MSTYAVTGGAGFIGSSIVARLLADGHEVRVVDDLSSGRMENLVEVPESLAFFRGDICDAALLRGAFDGADCVFHQAAVASVPQSVADPVATERVNVAGTLTVLEAARECRARRVVFASSCAVYGDPAELPTGEHTPPAPASPYAVSKLAGEHYCRVFRDLFGIETVSLRYFNVFGPRQNPASQYAAAIPIFITALAKGERPTVFGDGEQTRDFVFVDDVVEANLLAARARDAAGGVFNVGSGERVTIDELVTALREILDSNVEPRHVGDRPGDVRHSRADISAARQALSYEPAVGFKEGLRRTVEWFRVEGRSGG